MDTLIDTFTDITFCVLEQNKGIIVVMATFDASAQVHVMVKFGRTAERSLPVKSLSSCCYQVLLVRYRRILGVYFLFFFSLPAIQKQLLRQLLL